MEKIVIIGCGGHAKSVVDIIEREQKYEIVGFADQELNELFEYRGYKIVATDENLHELLTLGVKNAVIGIGFMGESNVREKIYRKLQKVGFNFPVIIDPTAVIALDAEIMDGTVVGKKVVVNSAAYVGNNVILNTASVIEHECKIGNGSHIAVGSLLCGDVEVGSNSFIGAGTTIIQGCKVGDSVLVGAGSLVLGDIKANTRCVGIIKRG